MSAQGPEAIDDYSKSRRPRAPSAGGIGGLATGALGLGLAGAILAFVATFSTVIEIRVLTVTPFSQDGMDRYGPALIVLGVFGLLMVAGAWRGARPAMGALALAGVGVLLIAVLVDVPNLNDKGVWPLADQYEDASASAGRGFYFETAAGVLMLLSGVLALLLAPRETRERPAVRERPAAAEPGAQRAAGDGGWFVEPPVESRAQRLTQPPSPPRRRQGGIVDRIRRKR